MAEEAFTADIHEAYIQGVSSRSFSSPEGEEILEDLSFLLL